MLDDDDDDDVMELPPPLAQPPPVGGLVEAARRPGPPRGSRIFRFPQDPDVRASGRPHLEYCPCDECKLTLEDYFAWFTSSSDESDGEDDNSSIVGGGRWFT